MRLEFIPAIVDSDWLFIGNLQAIKHMMKAIQKEDRNQYQEAEREIQLALRSLRNELEAYSPNERSVINVQPSEFMKLSLVLFLARYFDDRREILLCARQPFAVVAGGRLPVLHTLLKFHHGEALPRRAGRALPSRSLSSMSKLSC